MNKEEFDKLCMMPLDELYTKLGKLDPKLISTSQIDYMSNQLFGHADRMQSKPNKIRSLRNEIYQRIYSSMLDNPLDKKENEIKLNKLRSGDFVMGVDLDTMKRADSIQDIVELIHQSSTLNISYEKYVELFNQSDKDVLTRALAVYCLDRKRAHDKFNKVRNKKDPE